MAAPHTASTFGVRDLIRDRATAFRFTSVLGLQMGQMLPAAFIALFLPVIFRQQGLPLDMYWVFALPAIPTWLRPLWAPLVDRTGNPVIGMRKSWFIPCTAFGGLAYLSLTLFTPTPDNLAIIVALLVIKSTIMTTQDIAIDGYMVENIRDEERPVAAAVLDVGRAVASFIAMMVIPLIYSKLGWAPALATASVLLVAFSLPGILRREPPRPERFTRNRPSLARLLGRRDSYYIYPLCFFIAMMGGLITNLYATYLSDLGFSIGRMALVLGPAMLLGSALGAGATSWFLRRFGYKTTLLLGAFAILVAVIPIIWMGSLPSPALLIVFLVTLNGIALQAILLVTFQAARLKWASKSQAATDYTTQIVATMAGHSLATAVGGWLAGGLGWFYYFMLAGVLISSACFVLYGLYDRIETLVDERDTVELGAQIAGNADPSDSGGSYAARRV